MAPVLVSALFWPFLEFLTLETNTLPFTINNTYLLLLYNTKRTIGCTPEDNKGEI